MKAIRFVWLMMLAVPALAQETDIDDLQQDSKAQDRIRAAQAAYITERLELTADEAERFWPVYREFLEKRRQIRARMREARRGGRDEKELLDLQLTVRQQELDLEKEYAARLQKIVPAGKLIHLRQAETDFRKLLLRQLQQRRDQAEKMQRQRQRSQERPREKNK